jgi:hypothetical protein
MGVSNFIKVTEAKMAYIVAMQALELILFHRVLLSSIQGEGVAGVGREPHSPCAASAQQGRSSPSDEDHHQVMKIITK